MKKIALTVGLSIALGGAANGAAAGLTRIPQIETSPLAQTVQLKRRDRKSRRERRSDRYEDLPQEHIDYCIRLNMGYRVSDNSIAADRYTRRKCVSPFYR